jgi:CCR4-NOT transcription complex subunit 1
MQHEPILVAVVKYLLNKPNFSTVFSESMKNVEINESFLESFCSGLQLSLLEKIAISLALSDSENPDARLCGKYEVLHQFLLNVIPTSVFLTKMLISSCNFSSLSIFIFSNVSIFPTVLLLYI